MQRVRLIVSAILVAAALMAGLAPCPPQLPASSAEAVELVPLCPCHLGDGPATVTIGGLWSAIPSGFAYSPPTLPGPLAPAPPATLPSPPHDPLGLIPISV